MKQLLFFLLFLVPLPSLAMESNKEIKPDQYVPEQRTTIEDIPLDVVAYMFQYLDLNDICRLTITCKLFEQGMRIANKNRFNKEALKLIKTYNNLTKLVALSQDQQKETGLHFQIKAFVQSCDTVEDQKLATYLMRKVVSIILSGINDSDKKKYTDQEINNINNFLKELKEIEYLKNKDTSTEQTWSKAHRKCELATSQIKKEYEKQFTYYYSNHRIIDCIRHLFSLLSPLLYIDELEGDKQQFDYSSNPKKYALAPRSCAIQ